jgi:hypothetical protein
VRCLTVKIFRPNCTSVFVLGQLWRKYLLFSLHRRFASWEASICSHYQKYFRPLLEPRDQLCAVLRFWLRLCWGFGSRRMWRCVAAWVVARVSINRSALVFSVAQARKTWWWLNSLTAKMNALQSFEASVTVHPTTRRRVPDDLSRQKNLCTVQTWTIVNVSRQSEALRLVSKRWYKLKIVWLECAVHTIVTCSVQ